MKKKPQGKEKANTVYPELFISWKETLRNYLSIRFSIFKLLEQICNVRNKATYISSSRVNASIGAAVDGSRFSLFFDEKLYNLSSEVSQQIELGKLSVMNCQTVLESISQIESESIPCDKSWMEKIFKDIKQQYELEIIAAKTLCDLDNESIDNDAMVTLLACYNYPPYLNLSETLLILGS
jgi:hypothetical protein